MRQASPQGPHTAIEIVPTIVIAHRRSRSSWEYGSSAVAELQGGGASLLDSFNMATHAARRHLSDTHGRDVSMEETRRRTHHTMQRGNGPTEDLRLPGDASHASLD